MTYAKFIENVKCQNTENNREGFKRNKNNQK